MAAECLVDHSPPPPPREVRASSGSCATRHGTPDEEGPPPDRPAPRTLSPVSSTGLRAARRSRPEAKCAVPGSKFQRWLTKPVPLRVPTDHGLFLGDQSPVDSHGRGYLRLLGSPARTRSWRSAWGSSPSSSPSYCSTRGTATSRGPTGSASWQVGVFGTMAADVLHVGFGVPYAVSSSLYAARAGGGVRRLAEDREDPFLPQRRHSPAGGLLLGGGGGHLRPRTAVGDLTAVTFHLGYLDSGLMFAGVISSLPSVTGALGGTRSSASGPPTSSPALGASFADYSASRRPSAASGGGGRWPWRSPSSSSAWWLFCARHPAPDVRHPPASPTGGI